MLFCGNQRGGKQARRRTKYRLASEDGEGITEQPRLIGNGVIAMTEIASSFSKIAAIFHAIPFLPLRRKITSETQSHDDGWKLVTRVL
ncbi:hypothetical protein TNCT_661841 [Trichonephila clavata]|uniref:Uncharacterized protein n=1 Tax=Trichonephila clavata TaxID=2740835 RepID=A0A8X6G270_TRICU|nr:hypothetical protein TNCT_661841 [Trichonephila clavata]